MSIPNGIEEREEYFLSCVENNQYVANWERVDYSEKGHTISLWVQSDALKIEGVRVSVSAKTCQKIADKTDCLMLTPKIADIIFHMSKVKLKPRPQPISSQTSSMISYSAGVDKVAQEALKGLDGTTIIDTVGKYWCISNELLADSRGFKGEYDPSVTYEVGESCYYSKFWRKALVKTTNNEPTNPKFWKTFAPAALNYGWHFTDGATFGGIKGYPCDSLLKNPSSGLTYHVIQPSAKAHDWLHTDYSQVHRSVKRYCLLNGVEADLVDVLQHPEFSRLVNHDGVLNVLRQPGVLIL